MPSCEALYRAQRALDLGHQPPARRRHDLGRPADQPAGCTGDGRYGWLPLVRDRDLWPLQQKFNTILEQTAKALGDVYVAVPAEAFGDADFVDHGHFSQQGARRFAGYLAPVVREACR